MTLDVTWDGVVLAKGAQAREEDGGWFVELEQPMPVGTRLELSGDTQAVVQVTRVHEGVGAGMVVKRADSQKPESEEQAKDDGKKEKRKKGRKS